MVSSHRSGGASMDDPAPERTTFNAFALLMPENLQNERWCGDPIQNSTSQAFIENRKEVIYSFAATLSFR